MPRHCLLSTSMWKGNFSWSGKRSKQALIESNLAESFALPFNFSGKKPEPRDSNRSLLTELQQAEASGADPGKELESTSAVLLEKVPKFKTKVEEIKWKLNKARKKLKIAKQYVALADKVATLRKKARSGSKNVKDVIRKAEVALVHAGEHMGLDYVHFKK